MVHRTPSGDIVGSTKPNIPIVDPTCWPSTQSVGSAQPSSIKPDPHSFNPSKPSGAYQFELLPSFPRTLFEFRKYDGAKALTVLLLVLAGLYFLLGFFGFLVDHTAWLKALLAKPPLPDISPKSHGGSFGNRSALLSPMLPPMSILPFASSFLSVPIV